MSTVPRVIGCVGGGGVGKTSTSAALAVAFARSGLRALIITIDPARRLAGALGVPLSHTVTPVALPDASGSLSALMPDPRRSTEAFLDLLFASEPAAGERVRRSRLFRALSDATAGVHEIVSLSLLADTCARGDFDVVVLDTAPSRNALAFVSTPGRLADLLGGRAVGFLASIAARANSPRSSGLFARLGGSVEGLVGRVVGPNLLSETAALFTELARVRTRFVDLAGRASELMLGPRARWLLVGAPTAAARDDLVFMSERLRGLGQSPRAILLNRAELLDAAWLASLESLSPSLATARGELLAEHAAREAATRETAEDLARRLPGIPLRALPLVADPDPAAVVQTLAEALAPHLGDLV